MIAITAGDPCGVGPEVVLKALRQPPPALVRTHLIIIGDHAVFETTAKQLRQRLPIWHRVRELESWKHGRPGITFVDCQHPFRFMAGRASRESGEASLAYLDRAVALSSGHRIQALVTAPVTKWAIHRVHQQFVGQTEYLAEAMNARDVAMMFVSDRLRVVLLTRHLPLREVVHVVDRRLVRTTLRLTARALRQAFRIPRPQLALCGLNPHAGEAGLFGAEERHLLLPVMRELRRERIACDGPFAADGFFAASKPYDAVVCWYHDQGLIPFKLLARDRGCQMTIGLPIIRTSPDHGSALDIAGKGMANPGSMVYAIQLAIQLLARGARC